MEIAIIVFSIVIIGAVAYAFYIYNWLNSENAKGFLYKKMPEVIVRTYNVETIKDSFLYSNDLDRMMYSASLPKYLPKDAVKHHITYRAQMIGKHLLESGFIEVLDRPMLHENPYVNRVDMRLRVFKDGAVEQDGLLPNP